MRISCMTKQQSRWMYRTVGGFLIVTISFFHVFSAIAPVRAAADGDAPPAEEGEASLLDNLLSGVQDNISQTEQAAEETQQEAQQQAEDASPFSGTGDSGSSDAGSSGADAAGDSGSSQDQGSSQDSGSSSGDSSSQSGDQQSSGDSGSAQQNSGGDAGGSQDGASQSGDSGQSGNNGGDSGATGNNSSSGDSGTQAQGSGADAGSSSSGDENGAAGSGGSGDDSTDGDSGSSSEGASSGSDTSSGSQDSSSGNGNSAGGANAVSSPSSSGGGTSASGYSGYPPSGSSATSTPTTTPDIIKDADITTGDADTDTTVGNAVNNNDIDASGEPAGGGAYAATSPGGSATSTPSSTDEMIVGNTDTGEDSENNASASDETEVSVGTDNDADIENDVVGEANSGKNEIEAEGQGSAVKNSSINTGDAQASASVGNTANTNTVYTGSGGGVDYPWMRTTVINEDTGADSENVSELDVKRSYSVINENDARLVNRVALDANSGENLVSADYKVSNSDITTGNARALANIINFANVNWIDSEVLPYVRNTGGGDGNIYLWNLLSGKYGSDVVKRFFVGNRNTGEGSTNTAIANIENSLEIRNTNTGNILNDVTVKATSGMNKFLSNYKVKDSTITTGNVDAVVNLFNFLNANFINASFLFSMVNIFGDYSGTLVLPGEKKLFGSPPAQDTVTVSNENTGEDSINEAIVVLNEETEIKNDNTAEVKNDIDVDVETGNNNVIVGKKSKNVSIATGAADAITNVVNLVNKNVVGGTWFLGIFNFFDEVAGGFYNLPQGARVDQGPRSVIVSLDGYYPPAGGGAGTEYVVGNENTGEDSENYAKLTVTERTDISNANTAAIRNRIKIESDSGENEVQAGYKASNIAMETGDARAIANVSNFANLNFMNTKVVVSVFNVFGKFRGNITLGQADLSVLSYSGSVLQAGEGDTITYAFSYANNGDGRAQDTTIIATYDPTRVEVIDAGGGTDTGSGDIVWQGPELLPSGSTTFTYRVQVKQGISSGDMTSSVTVDDPTESPESEGDNTASYTVSISGSGGSGGSGSGNGGSSGAGGNGNGGSSGDDDASYQVSGSGGSGGSGSGNGGSGGDGVGGPNPAGNPNLVVTKEIRDPKDVYYPGDQITFVVEVANDGQGAAFEVKLYDQILDFAEEEMFSYTWDLDIVYRQTKKQVEYVITVPQEITPGTYTNFSRADGLDDLHNVVASNEAQVSFTIDVPQGESAQDEGAGGATAAEGPSSPAEGGGQEDEGTESEGLPEEEISGSDATLEDSSISAPAPIVAGISTTDNTEGGEGQEEDFVQEDSEDTAVLGAKTEEETGGGIGKEGIWLIIAAAALFALYLAARRRSRFEDAPI